MEFTIIILYFSQLRGMGASNHTSRLNDIIKVGITLNFHMVLRVARYSQFLAELMAKLSRGPFSLLSLHPVLLLLRVSPCRCGDDIEGPPHA